MRRQDGRITSHRSAATGCRCVIDIRYCLPVYILVLFLRRLINGVIDGSGGQKFVTLTAAPAPLDLSEIEPSRKRSLPPTTEGPPKRSKKGKKSKGSSKAVIPELNPSDYVRVVKVTNKDDLLHEGPVLLSKSDKASQMLLSGNRMSVTSSKGYRMVCFRTPAKLA